MKHVLPKTLKARLILILLLDFQKDKTFTEQLPWSQNIREHNFFFFTVSYFMDLPSTQ